MAPRSRAFGGPFCVAHSPLRTRTSPSPTTGRAPFPCTLLPRQDYEGGGKPSPHTQRSLFMGVTTVIATAPLEGPFSPPSPLTCCLGVCGRVRQEEGQSCWFPRTRPQDHTHLLREDCDDAHQHQALEAAQRRGLPSSWPRQRSPAAGHGGGGYPPHFSDEQFV